jgi:acetyltransferase
MERVNASKDNRLDSIFCPKSIAVLGVTSTPGTVPYDCFSNILRGGYTGKLYPIAPGKKAIDNIPAYRYVTDVSEPVDLAVIIFPSNVCDRALEMCGQKGIKSVVMISAGFRETGPEGAQRELRLREIIKQYGIDMIGPNCFGAINADPAIAMNASFSKKMPYHGNIGFLSQSGGMCAAALDYAIAHQIGFSKFVSFGNKAGVSEIDLLNYLHQDKQTDVIMMYLEELGVNGRAMIEAASRITRGPNAKPIVAIKSGRTPQGGKAATSHTGSRPSDDDIVEAVFHDAGIIRAYTFQQLFDLAAMLAYQPLPKGNRVAVITNTGGPGVLCTDAAMQTGELAMAQLTPETTKTLKDYLPATASSRNPVDVLGAGTSKDYGFCLDTTLADPNVDQAVVILTPHSMTDVENIAQSCNDAARKHGKPVATSFMGGEDVAVGVAKLWSLKMPHFLMPEYAAGAMADIQRILRWRTGKQDRAKTFKTDKAAAAAVLAGKTGVLSATDAKAVLKAYGLPDGAAAQGQRIVLGAKKDATFGATVLFGVGPLLIEVFHDVSFALAPLSLAVAGRMLRQVKGFKLLEDYAHLGAIEEALVRLGQLVNDVPAISGFNAECVAGPAGLSLASVKMELTA